MENIPKKIVDIYSYMYLPKKTEKFADGTSSGGFTIVNLVAIIIFFYAIYLSFKCNNGFTFWGFLGAFLFAPIYVLYKLTSDPKKCGITK
jgi:hypothetical protein